MTEPHVHRIIRLVGSQAIQAHLGVSEFSVKNAKAAGIFPSPWYGPLSDLCDEMGVPCPKSAFNWRSSDKKPVRPNVNDGADVQGPVSDEGAA